MRFSECEALLSTAPLTIETGVERLSSGGLHVAVLSLLENCTGAMLEHWFGMDCNTDEYRLWHPGAHLHSEWVKREECKEDGTAAGKTHLATEIVGGTATDATLAYIDPYELFGEKLTKAREENDVSVVLYAQCMLGPRDQIIYDEKGRPQGGQYVGVGRDTPYGLMLRNHYWMGDTLPLPADQVEKMFPMEMGLGVMNHDLNEFHILNKVMPSYYLRDCWEELGAPEPFAKSKPLSTNMTPRILA